MKEPMGWKSLKAAEFTSWSGILRIIFNNFFVWSLMSTVVALSKKQDSYGHHLPFTPSICIFNVPHHFFLTVPDKGSPCRVITALPVLKAVAWVNMTHVRTCFDTWFLRLLWRLLQCFGRLLLLFIVLLALILSRSFSLTVSSTVSSSIFYTVSSTKGLSWCFNMLSGMSFSYSYPQALYTVTIKLQDSTNG